MFYKYLNNEFGKNLFVMKKSGKEISEAQRNFYYYKSCDLHEEENMYEVAVKNTPDKCYGCYIIMQNIDYINGRYLGRNAVWVNHLFYLDDKNIIKYVKLNGKLEIVDCVVLKDGIVEEFDKYENDESEKIAHFMSEVSGTFHESIKKKIENKIILTEREKEEIENIYKTKGNKFEEYEGDIVLTGVKIFTEDKEYFYGYRSTITTYYVFRGNVEGYSNRAKLKVTSNSMKKYFESIGKGICNEEEVRKIFEDKKVMFDGKFSTYANVVIGKNVNVCSIIE